MSCFIEMLLLSCTSLFHQDSSAGEFYEASPIYLVDVQTLQRRLLPEELRQLTRIRLIRDFRIQRAHLDIPNHILEPALELALVDILRQQISVKHRGDLLIRLLVLTETIEDRIDRLLLVDELQHRTDGFIADVCRLDILLYRRYELRLFTEPGDELLLRLLECRLDLFFRVRPRHEARGRIHLLVQR